VLQPPSNPQACSGQFLVALRPTAACTLRRTSSVCTGVRGSVGEGALGLGRCSQILRFHSLPSFASTGLGGRSALHETATDSRRWRSSRCPHSSFGTRIRAVGPYFWQVNNRRCGVVGVCGFSRRGTSSLDLMCGTFCSRVESEAVDLGYQGVVGPPCNIASYWGKPLRSR
jgi:hypothetical protein